MSRHEQSALDRGFRDPSVRQTFLELCTHKIRIVKLRGGFPRVHLPAVVHLVRAVLAAGAIGVDHLSIRVACAVAFPAGRNCPSRRARTRLGGNHTSSPPVECAVPILGGLCIRVSADRPGNWRSIIIPC